MNRRVVVRIIVAIVGLQLASFGLWALFGPQSFYDVLATYPPYNVHLFRDVGAFQTGIGATLLYALFRRDALQVALVGGSVGAILHAVSHVMDRGHGGRSSDPIVLSGVAIVLVVATALHTSQRRR